MMVAQGWQDHGGGEAATGIGDHATFPIRVCPLGERGFEVNYCSF
jgi:hypothetical protein